MALREASRYLSADDAYDAAQEAAIRAWRGADTCAGAPEPWLRTIARNEALRLATRRKEVPLPDDYELLDTNDEEPPSEWLEVAVAISSLARGEQEALLLRYWSDKTDAQIALMLGVPIGTVKVRLHRAHTKLARSLADWRS